MIPTFLLLFTAHLLGDFICQPSAMVRHKARLSVLLFHVTLITILTALLLGSLPPLVLAVVFVSHFILDYLKNSIVPAPHREQLKVFLIDQGLHILVLIGIAASLPNLAQDSNWARILSFSGLTYFYQTLVIVDTIILAIPVGGILIAKATRAFSEEIADSPELNSLEGLKNGGKIIGYLERALVLLFLFVGHPGGIGFLVAAKSILRFGDIKDPGQRKVTEYIIIGTFLSFGWALAVSILARHTLSLR